MIRHVLHHPHPTLLQIAEPVTTVTDELVKLATDMIETMYAYNGLGLAAPQVGELVRLVVMRDTRPSNAFPVIIFNPKITARSGQQVAKEGCLSVPKVYEYVKRAREITVEGMTILGDPYRETHYGYNAVILQHEIDHLDGLEFIDHLNPARRLLALKNSAKYRTRIHPDVKDEA